jgi:hypothetical protein
MAGVVMAEPGPADSATAGNSTVGVGTRPGRRQAEIPALLRSFPKNPAG